MITLGIDLSAQRAGTAACLIDWQREKVVVSEPQVGCSDAELDEVIGRADAVGIDAPFGWPKPFIDAVASWTLKEWSPEIRDRLQFRATDRFVRDMQRRWPLSVSTDKIALPAMRAMALLNRHGVTDRSGDGLFFEIYPAASLHAWGISNRGYKQAKDEACVAARAKILTELRVRLPQLELPSSAAATSDTLDSLIASLTTRAAAIGRARRPGSELIELARTEGSIHVPIGPMAEDLAAEA